MKKRYLILLLSLLLLALASTSYAWQGRMGGMGDPYGLVTDETDFLIHPAKIANGEGVRFYGDYRFTYTGVTDWDDRYEGYDLAGVLQSSWRTDVSGEELGHTALLGTSFPLGPGRMGLFFAYAGMRGDYDGDNIYYPGGGSTVEINDDLDGFALRLLYGLPIGGFKLGAETQFAYRQEKQGMNENDLTNEYLNIWWIPYPFPHKSRYWEALFKGSLEGKVGPLDLECTLRGGFDFGGTNKWGYEMQIPPGTPISGWDLKGDVQGWQIGGDLWLRYPLAADLILPVLVRVDYQTKTRDGDGPGWGGAASNYFDYQNETQDLAITVGGGVDKEFGKETRIAAGIYYNYLQSEEVFSWNVMYSGGWYREAWTYPDSIEHRILLRMAGEHALSPVVTLRTGLNVFYGWVTGEIRYSGNDSTGSFDIEELSGHGSHWGIGLSFGGTVQVKPVVLEPFVSGGYQQFRLNTDGVSFDNTGLYGLDNEKITRNEWFVSTGLSVLFDL